MKKVILLSVFVTALFLNAKPQTITVADSNETNEFYPLSYRIWQNPQRGQVLYPASLLTEMQGNYITGLSLYFHVEPFNNNQVHLDGTQNLRICTTENANLSTGFVSGSLKTVWNGCMDDITIGGVTQDGEVRIYFDSAFYYEGGNLIVEIETNHDALTNQWYMFFWYGKNTTTALSRTWSQDSYSTYESSANFIPKTTFRYQETDCIQPSLFSTSNTSPYSTTISWNTKYFENVPVSEYEISYKRLEDDSYDVVTAYDTFVELTELESATDYVYIVRTACGNNSYSVWSDQHSFRTDIAPSQLPYFCGFEDTQENNSWVRTKYRNNNDYTWYIDTATHYEGDKSMYISKNHGASFSTLQAYYDDGDVWAYRDIDFDSIYPSYTLRFQHRGHQILYAYVGPPATPSGKATPAGAVKLNSTYIARTDDWKTCEFTIDNTHTGLQRIYFMFYNGTPTNVGAAIDNIQVFGNNCVAPVNLVATPQDSAAVLSWQPVCVTPPYGYVVAYKKNSDDAFTEITVTDPSCTIEGLQPYTDYTWKVCVKSSGNIDYGWSATSTFKTKVTTVRNLPYFCDFEDEAENAGWTLVPMTGASNRWLIGTDQKYSGSKSLYITSYNNYYQYNDIPSAVWAYRDIMFDTVAKNIVIDFNYKVGGNEGYDYAKVFIGDTATPSGFTIPDGVTDITGELYTTYVNPGWMHKYVYLTDSTITGLKRIYLYWQNTEYYYQNPPIAIDNFSIMTTECSAPVNPSVSALDTVADLCWQPNVIGIAQTYTVAYKKSTDSVFTEITVADTSAHITDLQPYTDYNWKVKSNCTEADTSVWMNGPNFKTFHLIGHIPYAYGFEDSVENARWCMSHSSSQEPNRWYVDTAVSHQGSYSAYISNDNGLTVSFDSTKSESSTRIYHDFAFVPEYSEYDLSFDFKATRADLPANLKVYAIPATSPEFSYLYQNENNPDYEMNPAQVITGDTSWQNIHIKMHNNHTGLTRIVFLWKYDKYHTGKVVSPCIIDNVVITGNVMGEPYNLSAVPQTDTSALLSWFSGNNVQPQSYTLQYRRSTETAFTEVTLTDTSYVLQSLISPSEYIWRVRANGADSAHSDWSPEKTYRHRIVSLPMLCTFEEDADNSMWDYFRHNSTTYYQNLPTDTVSWIIGNALSRDGAKSMYISSDNGASNNVTTDDYLYLWTYRDVYFPPTSSFYYVTLDYKGSQPLTVCVGDYKTNPNLTASTSYFKNRFEIPKSDDWTHHHRMIIRYDSSYSGVKKVYFFWKYNSTGNISNAGAIDNFKIGVVECQELVNLSSSEITHNSAKLSWEKYSAYNANNCTDVQSYTVAYRTINSMQYTEVTVTDTFCVLSDLQSDAIYKWKVRTNCGDGAVGEYSAEASFVTLASLPYVCDFDGEMESAKWIFKPANYTYWAIGEDGIDSSNKRLLITGIWGANGYNYYAANNTWAYRDVYFNEGYSEYQISFDFKGLGQQNLDCAQVFIGPDTVSASGSVVPAELTQIGGNFCIVPSYRHYSFTIDSSFAGKRRIFFYWKNNSDMKGLLPGASFDNLEIQGSNCKIPLNPAVTGFTSTSADLTWDSPDSLDHNYTVAYKSENDSAAVYVQVSENVCHLSGLTPNTSYYWYVRTECDDNMHSLWSESRTFAISQEQCATLPYFNGFEDEDENSRWSFLSTDNVNTWFIGNATANDSASSMYITADSGVTNSYTNEALVGVWAWRDVMFDPGYRGYNLSFDHKGKGSASHYMNMYIGKPSLPVGIIAPEDAHMAIGPLYNIDNWTTQSVLLDSTHAGIQRVYFFWIHNTYTKYLPPAAIDNLQITGINCSAPESITSIVGLDTVILTWSPAKIGDNSAFTVAYMSEDETTFHETVVQDTFLILSNVVRNSTYVWKVKQNCSDSTDNLWSQEETFVTFPDFPYHCDFEDEAENLKWHFKNSSHQNKWYIGNFQMQGFSNTLYISSNNGVSNGYVSGVCNVWAYRDVYLNPNYDTTYISFDYRVGGEYGDDLTVFLGDCVEPSGRAAPQNSTILLDHVNGHSTLTNRTVAIPSSQAGLRRLFFLWRNDYFDVYNPAAAVDNIEISNQIYGTPFNLTASAIDTAAYLSWQRPANANPVSYTVEYKKTSETAATSVTVSSESLSIGNLSPNTSYTWRVRMNFDDGYEGNWNSSTFTTDSNVARLPYFCDFEDAAENASWKIFSSSSVNKWHIGSAVNHGGDSCLYVSNDGGTTNAYTVNASSNVWACRDIYFDPQYSQFKISFDYKGVGELYNYTPYDYAKLYIGPATTPNVNYSNSETSPQGCEQIGGLLYLKDDWVTVEDTLLTISESGMVRLYFLWRNDQVMGNNPPAAIDNLSIIPFGCGKPFETTTTDITNYSAKLNWNGSTNVFNVAYKADSDPDFTIISTPEHSLVLTGLMPSTDYQWKVQTACSDTILSEWSDVMTFSTHQIYAHTPYFCDFEDDVESSMWSFVNTDANQWTVGQAVGNGGSSMYVSADSGATNSYTYNTVYYIWAYRDISFDGDYDEYEVEFDYKSKGFNYHYCSVFIGDPVKPGGSAAPAGSTLIAGNINNKTSWTHYSVSLNTNNTGVRRLFFLWAVPTLIGGTNYNPPAAVDNISIVGHNCSKPVNLASANVTDNSAALTWSMGSSCAATSYIVAYRRQNSTYFEEIEADENSIVLEELLSSTTYVWKVKTVCSYPEESVWSDEKTFTTNYFVAQLPYINGFEDDYENIQWRYYHVGPGSDNWYPGSAVSCSGDKSMYISSNGGESNLYVEGSNYNAWTWRDIYIDSLTDQIQVSFDYKGNGYLSSFGKDFGRLLIGTPKNPSYTDNEGLIDVSGKLNSVENWTHYTFVVDVSDIVGVQRLYLQWHNEYLQVNPPGAFDNIVIVGGNCGLPTNITVDETTQNSIEFHFTPSSDEHHLWQTVIVKDGEEMNEDDIVDITDTSYTFTELEHSTLYRIYVRNVCDEDAFWNNIACLTDCGAIESIPYTQDFENVPYAVNVSQEMPLCWKRIPETAEVNIDYSFNYTNTLHFYCSSNSAVMAVLPEIAENISISDLMISFKAYQKYNIQSEIIVGVMEDPENDSTFTQIDVISPTSANIWKNYRAYFQNYTGQGKYVAFKANDYTYSYLDDIVLDYSPSCIPPSHITVDSITNNSAKVSWTPNGSESEWQVVVNDTITAVPQTVTAPVAVVNGLQPHWDFAVYVRAVCGPGEYSSWEKSDIYTTICDPVSQFPLVENFDEFQVPTVWVFQHPRPDCWSFPEIYGQQNPSVDFYESYSGTNSLQFCAGQDDLFFYNPSSYYATAVTPMLEADIHQLSVRFKLKSNWLYYPEGMEIGVTSDPNNMDFYEPVQYILPENSNSWYEYVVSFDSTELTGTNRHIVFRYHSTYNRRYNWIDDVVIDYTSNIYLAPTELTATSVTDSTATLVWKQDDLLTIEWLFEYRKVSESEWHSFIVNTKSITLTDLEPNTQYVARVAGFYYQDTTAFSDECTFTTTNVDIESHTIEHKISVYPNPAHNNVTVDFSDDLEVEVISLYSIDGKLIMRESPTEKSIRIPLRGLSDGFYFLEIVSDEGRITKKIIKK